MKLSSKGKFIRWAYLFAGDWEIPNRTNVCALFWRAFLLSPLKVLMMVVILVVAWPFLLYSWAREKGYTVWLDMPIRIRFPDIHISGGDTLKVIKQRINDWKNGVCTVVEIE